MATSDEDNQIFLNERPQQNDSTDDEEDFLMRHQAIMKGLGIKTNSSSNSNSTSRCDEDEQPPLFSFVTSELATQSVSERKNMKKKRASTKPHGLAILDQLLIQKESQKNIHTTSSDTNSSQNDIETELQSTQQSIVQPINVIDKSVNERKRTRQQMEYKQASSSVVITINGKAFQLEDTVHCLDEEEDDEKMGGDVVNKELEKKQQILNRISSNAFAENVPSMQCSLNNKTEILQRRKTKTGTKTKSNGYVRTAFNVMSSQLTFDYVFVCSRQRPNVQNIGLEKADIEYDIMSGINVNDYFQTSNPIVYAIDDRDLMANATSKMVVRNALFFGRQKQSSLVKTRIVRTHPQIVHIGLSSKELRQNAVPFDVYKHYLKDNEQAICDGDVDGFVKIVTAKDTDKIIGCTIVCSNASDMISSLSLCIAENIPLSKIPDVIYCHHPMLIASIKKCADDYNKTRLTPTSRILLRKILSSKR